MEKNTETREEDFSQVSWKEAIIICVAAFLTGVSALAFVRDGISEMGTRLTFIFIIIAVVVVLELFVELKRKSTQAIIDAIKESKCGKS